MEFLFEKLDVYQRSLALVDAIDAVIDSIKGRLPASRIDQLARASLSIPLNIAEGNGRRRYGERGHFFVIARGSVFECVAIFQVLRRKKLVSDEVYLARYGDLEVIARMLSGLVRHAESKQSPRRSTDATKEVSPPVTSSLGGA